MKSRFEKKLKQHIDMTLEAECPGAREETQTAPSEAAPVLPKRRFGRVLKWVSIGTSTVLIIGIAALGVGRFGSAFRSKSAVDMRGSLSYHENKENSIVTSKAAATQAAAGQVVTSNTSKAIMSNDIAGVPAMADSSGYGEGYPNITENVFKSTAENPVTTFSLDVDTASYSNIRRYINSGVRPPVNAVRIEEMINYFKYDYPEPTNGDVFSVTTEIGRSPWDQTKYLAVIGVKGKTIAPENLPNSNLVFLLDVSGSMSDPDKLPLLKSGMKLLVDKLTENDRISIVTYASDVSVVLKGARGDQKAMIDQALDGLQAGGSTAGGAGIVLAYDTAKEMMITGGNNRVIMATDGDLNVGIQSEEDLKTLIESKRNEGIFLSVMGFGTGNLQDSKLKTLSNYGNGNYSYIDSIREAERVLVNEMGSTLFTIAKDVKAQVSFNPDVVAQYRLVGYEDRALSNEDFTDDTKDAGDIGSGHTITAIYELIPAAGFGDGSRCFDFDLRYKLPDSLTSVQLDRSFTYSAVETALTSNFKFAAAVAEFGMILRNSQFKVNASVTGVMDLALGAIGSDPGGYRAEFINLVQKYSQIK